MTHPDGWDAEAKRLDALDRYQIMDTPSEPGFDRITRLAATLLDAPIALVSLIDERRQWFKARQGWDQRETDRAVAICAHTLDAREVMVVTDTHADERFRDNPLVVGDPYIRFYAGSPLINADGYALGTLCVLDREPHTHPGRARAQALRDLASLAMDELELRRARRAETVELRARESSERELHDRMRFQEAMLESLQDAIIACDADGRVTLFNRAARQVHGLDSEPVTPDQWAARYALCDPDSLEPLSTERIPLYRALHGEWVRSERLAVARPGERAQQFSVNGAPVFDGQRWLGAVVAMRDETPRLEAERELRRLADRMAYRASHDEVTDLLKRGELEAHIAGALSNIQQDAREHTLCYLDLDRFKLINDTAGYQAGDALLKQVAVALAANVRERTDLVARTGGDEFAVLLGDCGIDSGALKAEQLRRAIADIRLRWGGEVIQTTASFGVAPLLADACTAGEMLLRANAACDRGKAAGGDRVTRQDEGASPLAARRSDAYWVRAVRAALEEHRLTLFEQPIVALMPSADGSSKAELLVRMRDTDGELVSPGEFLPVAERYGLMPRLDRWVVEHAFGHIAALLRSGGDENAGTREWSINLSGATLSDDRFPDVLAQLIGRYGVPPSAVCFEITESAAVTQLAQARRLIDELRSRGFRFALDDFGTGVSSFSYLHHFNADYIKIDGSFVRRLCESPLDRTIVETIHRIATTVGAATIAEFVEDERTAGELRRMGVNYGQGFGLAKPRLWSAYDGA